MTNCPCDLLGEEKKPHTDQSSGPISQVLQH